MTEAELVDLVAAAICQTFARREDAWARAKPLVKERYRAEARAALQVIRLHGALRQIGN